MTALLKERMTANEFLAWATQQPDRWELFDGIPTAMSPERVIHTETEYQVARAFDEAIRRAGVRCRFLLDGPIVRIDSRNSYQPDLLVYCGDPAPGDAVEIPNPVIVVEVLPPSNALRDFARQIAGLFSSPQHSPLSDRRPGQAIRDPSFSRPKRFGIDAYRQYWRYCPRSPRINSAS